jgi:hypothetical protein
MEIEIAHQILSTLIRVEPVAFTNVGPGCDNHLGGDRRSVGDLMRKIDDGAAVDQVVARR